MFDLGTKIILIIITLCLIAQLAVNWVEVKRDSLEAFVDELNRQLEEAEG